MLFGKRGPRPSKAVRKKEAFRPRGENLEAKILMAFDLGSTTPPALPNIATGNVGINMVGSTTNQNAGASVAELGDINGTGYDSFLIGSPTGTAPSVSLVFGSQQQSTATTTTTLDWLNTTVPLVTNVAPNGRVGALNTLGTIGQVNPISGSSTGAYNFTGITFIASKSGSSQLGFSVANAGVINGTQAFLIGAPNALDAAGDATSIGSGRVYLVYGSTNLLGLSGQTIDLDNPTATAGISVVTYATSVLGSRLGASVAGIGNFLNDGSNDIAMGATNATVGTGGTANSGAVYVVSANGIPTSTNTTPIDVSLFGQAGGTAGLVLAGAAAGNQAGFAVSGAGDVNGDGLGDLLIGAPAAAGGNGTAYLVYGGNLGGLVTNNFNYNFISLARVGQPTGSSPAPVAGAAISGGGGAGSERAGAAVYSAGDFNSDGVADIMIGSPNFGGSSTTANQGRVTILYGGANNIINGIFTLNTIPAAVSSLSLIGNLGDMAGSALGFVAPINSGQTNEVLIGAPGNNSAYLLPGHGGTYTGSFQLSDAENPATLAGVQFTATTPGFGATAFGSSVSGRLATSGQIHTADSDLVGDFIIGAPSYTIASGATAAGGGFIVQGAMITLGIPPATNVIQTTITQIDSSTTSPFAVNPTTPDAMKIYVTNSTTPTGLPFVASTDIDPTTITVNGVLFANATVTADPNNANQAIITISPRSALKLPSGNSTLVVSGKTLAGSPEGVQTFQGTAAINGGSGGGGSGGGSTVGAVSTPLPPGLFTPVSYLSQFGGSFVPTISAMSQYNYAPIPMSVALSQYLPPAGFRQRIQAFHGQKVAGRRQNASRNNDTGTGVWTLGRSVYNRGKFHNGNTYTWVHSGIIVPTTRKVQRFTSAGNKLPG
ncbi:MAG: hypothetical protein P4L85_19185 [Paludisphaera borealis]|uniref:beta strand repeat-containing protein n=1 Tax=Paludisphaera borealis TaxID=1387353 RepID=UPI002844C0BE|nr:hypothetical protein [Paludisphaera borealis]MDR3621483.1 hypothetical protein [Paludisphaera borealis]